MTIPQATFSEVPVLSLGAARDRATKAAFLEQLRDALMTVGFMYISDTGLPQDLVDSVMQQARGFFDEGQLPLTEKERIEMKNQKSFLGWSRVSYLHFNHWRVESSSESSYKHERPDRKTHKIPCGRLFVLRIFVRTNAFSTSALCAFLAAA